MQTVEIKDAATKTAHQIAHEKEMAVKANPEAHAEFVADNGRILKNKIWRWAQLQKVALFDNCTHEDFKAGGYWEKDEFVSVAECRACMAQKVNNEDWRKYRVY